VATLLQLNSNMVVKLLEILFESDPSCVFIIAEKFKLSNPHEHSCESIEACIWKHMKIVKANISENKKNVGDIFNQVDHQIHLNQTNQANPVNFEDCLTMIEDQFCSAEAGPIYYQPSRACENKSIQSTSKNEIIFSRVALDKKINESVITKQAEQSQYSCVIHFADWLCFTSHMNALYSSTSPTTTLDNHWKNFFQKISLNTSSLNSLCNPKRSNPILVNENMILDHNMLVPLFIQLLTARASFPGVPSILDVSRRADVSSGHPSTSPIAFWSSWLLW